ncbi:MULTISPECIES: hypothetical protein [unclassified Methylobacterium]|jgi:hypothetical protein|uniref:hypothetical protein n=1 Tax=unclassified Methylobacterium TaxID=2615210 RepID=UPI00135475E1|nr:hypothetical protein [Methylobacterium sp. 2A]MWV21902.1 hypothetical protein [Methylobacterium sp. 2A]
MSVGSILRAGCFLILICVGAAVLTGAAWGDALTDGRFRAEVAALIRGIRPGVRVLLEADPAQLSIGTKTIDLTNLYQRVDGLSAAERRREVEEFLSVAFAKAAPGPETGDFAAIRSRLRPQLVPDEILQQYTMLAHRRFSETLHVVYVLDEPNRYQYVTRAMLAGWQVDPALVEATAVANLAATSREAPFELVLGDGAPLFAMANAGDDFAIARLLVPSYLDEIRRALKADSITLAGPTRNLLLAWPSGSPARRDLAAEATRYLRTGPYGRSDELFRFDGRQVRPLNTMERADHGR